MIVHAYGGLSNRLRVIFSHLATHGPIGVVWVPDGEIAGARFEDVFMPLAGVTFYYHATGASYRTCDPAPGAPAGWEESYRKLHLRPEYRDKLNAICPPEPYSAIHVRRTDHRDYAPACTDATQDEEFLRFIDDEAHQDVYIATDNGTTQREFRRYVERTCRKPHTNSLMHIHERQDVGGQRNSTLADAAIDLFICAGADDFMGSRHSSFTNLIHTLRGLRTHA